MKEKYYDLEKHVEQEHGGAGAHLREFILGWQDGLVNVLGVILGVAAATRDARIVIVAGLAATFAESISMAAVAYTSTNAEISYYERQREKERRSIENNPHEERQEVYEGYYRKGFRGKLLDKIVQTITRNKKTWLEFMMNEELNLQRKDRSKSVKDSLLVGGSAVFGSLIPLIPFFWLPVASASIGAVMLSLLALFGVGVMKAKTTVGDPLKSGLEMLVVGGLAAGVGYGVGALVGQALS